MTLAAEGGVKSIPIVKRPEGPYAEFHPPKNTDLSGFSHIYRNSSVKNMCAVQVWPVKTSLELPAVGDV